jgi:predicted HicB family RNase H-like nuclease
VSNLPDNAPQSPQDERFTSFLYIRAKPSDKGSWVKAARREQKKLSEWVTEVLNFEARRDE